MVKHWGSSSVASIRLIRARDQSPSLPALNAGRRWWNARPSVVSSSVSTFGVVSNTRGVLGSCRFPEDRKRTDAAQRLGDGSRQEGLCGGTDVTAIAFRIATGMLQRIRGARTENPEGESESRL